MDSETGLKNGEKGRGQGRRFNIERTRKGKLRSESEGWLRGALSANIGWKNGRQEGDKLFRWTEHIEMSGTRKREGPIRAGRRIFWTLDEKE